MFNRVFLQVRWSGVKVRWSGVKRLPYQHIAFLKGAISLSSLSLSYIYNSVVDHAGTEIAGNKKTRQINGLINEWYRISFLTLIQNTPFRHWNERTTRWFAASNPYFKGIQCFGGVCVEKMDICWNCGFGGFTCLRIGFHDVYQRIEEDHRCDRRRPWGNRLSTTIKWKSGYWTYQIFSYWLLSLNVK